MNAPLKFCLTCGRLISEADKKRFGGIKALGKGGVTKRLGEVLSPASFGLSKKSYGMQRSMREFLLQFSLALGFIFFVIFGLKYFLEHVLPTLVPKQAVPAPKIEAPTDGKAPVSPGALPAPAHSDSGLPSK